METIIANPARKRNRRKGPKRMTAKQKRYFGTKRQRAALKHKRNSPKKRHNSPRKHAARTRSAPRKRNRKRTQHRKRTNPGAIYALVNPAKGKHRMAKSRKHHKKASGKSSAGSRRRNPSRRHSYRRHRNPGQVGNWLQLGVGAVVGGVGATTLPNLVLSSSNTGVLGYAGTLAATGLLAWAGHAFVKKPMVTSGIIAGGVGALIRRVIQDYSLLGSYTSSLGMGDIITDFQFGTPQTIAGGMRQLNNPYQGSAVPVAVAAPPAGAGVGSLYGPQLY
jgi:hypothetical protein